MRRLLVLTLLALCAGGVARAQDVILSGTLKTINERGTILIGYRETAPPFSFLNPGKQPVGFSVDICHNFAEDVAAQLNRELVEADAPSWRTGVRIVYVPVAAEERLAKLTSGAIDLECGATTANAERMKTISFSPVFFLAGTKLMVPLVNGRPALASYRALAGKTVAVSTGTTNAVAVKHLSGTVSPPIKVVEAPTRDAAYDMLVAGTADAFASDDILLAGYIATRPDGKRFGITGDYLSFEPYAIGLRKDDPQFTVLVKDTFARLASDGALNRLYDRWLVDRLPNGETLNVPMSPALGEMYRALSAAD